MSLPITVPYTFANATTSIPLSQLDTDIATIYSTVNGIGNGTVALSNVVITGGIISNVSGITTSSISNGTSNVSIATANGSVVVSTAGNTAITVDTSQNMISGGTVVMASSFKRNRIINGNMQIWQRATTATGNYSTGYAYTTVDRWAIYSPNSSTTVSQSTSVPTGFQYSVKVQRPSGSTATGSIQLGQCIESLNCYDLAAQTDTLSFWAKAGANFSGSSLGLTIPTGTVADQGIANYASWTGLTYPLNTTTAITTTWTKYTFTVTFGAGVLEANVQFNYIPTGTAGADDAVYITGVQLEVGTKATPYEMQIYSDQLAQCQRYYQTVPAGTLVAPINVWSTTTFSVALRATPSGTILGISGGSFTDGPYFPQGGITFLYSATSGFGYAVSAEL